MPLPSRDAPPFGLGLAPRSDLVGRLRDRVAKALTLGTLERIIALHMNPLRANVGLSPVKTIEDVYLAASVVLAYTAEPFEYPRSDWPAKLRLVGPGLWEPPAEPPAWLDELRRPLVLVTCSTLFQNDRRLAETACHALAGEPYDVVVTTADVDPPASRRRPTSGSGGSCRTRRCSSAPPASSATPAWGSPRRRSPTASQLSLSPSGATSRRSHGGSRWLAPAFGSRHGG